MIHQLKAVIGFQEFVENVGTSSSNKSTESASDATKVKITDLGLSARIASALEGAGIKSAAGLARKTATALKELDGIGEKAIEEISGALAGCGLTLKSE
jgi:DNA-directed RNA polymerase alpha subunit